ncbi:serine/threonine-protein kinase [Streptomyces sp. CA-181903]|uniref:serine/threonine-protein kinase n=1 Tax=Streptomyces sp. CA-181903 TaxID=3240055 RepID=UPI003D8CF42E
MQGSSGGPGSDGTRPLPPGHRIGGWEVTGPIAAGGWGTVYAGRPATPGTGGPEVPRTVALKILPTGGLAPSQARKVAEVARREVEFGRRARHPRLIRLLDSVEVSDPDQPFLDGAIVLVMERAACSLRERLDTAVTGAEGARLVEGICEGLAHLHRSGWVHGDLKPDNVLLMADGSVKLSDFGLVTELTGTHGTHGYAPPMGTFDYLPPERWNASLSEQGVRVRPSADIWALGIVIHQVFASGASPFPGATPVSRAAAAQEYADGRAPLRLDPAVPPFWRQLVTDCLAPAHAARAEHTAESLLDRIASHVATADASDTPAAGKPRRPRRTRALRTGLTVTVCGALAAGWWYAARDTAPPRPGRDGASTAAAAGPSSGVAAGRVRVFNADRTCRDRAGKPDPNCSLGLAIDPLRPYTPDNVVPTRVWHGDVLAVDCRLPQGLPIVDETGLRSSQWFRVRLPAGSSGPGTAWLPAVRTKDRPSVPVCPRPTPPP